MQSPICCYYEKYFYIKHIHHEYAQLDLKVQVVRRNINRISIKKFIKDSLIFHDGDPNYY